MFNISLMYILEQRYLCVEFGLHLQWMWERKSFDRLIKIASIGNNIYNICKT